MTDATACNTTDSRLGAGSCIVDGIDIIFNIEYGRQIFDFAMRDVIREATLQVVIQSAEGDRVLHDSEIPWQFYRQGFLIAATTPGRGPRILTWEVLSTSMHGLYPCGYYQREYREMYTSIWDMQGNLYADINLQNRVPRAIQ